MYRAWGYSCDVYHVPNTYLSICPSSLLTRYTKTTSSYHWRCPRVLFCVSPRLLPRLDNINIVIDQTQQLLSAEQMGSDYIYAMNCITKGGRVGPWTCSARKWHLVSPWGPSSFLRGLRWRRVSCNPLVWSPSSMQGRWRRRTMVGWCSRPLALAFRLQDVCMLSLVVGCCCWWRWWFTRQTLTKSD